MPRLQNSRTGVVVNVDDKTAERLGADWGSVKPPAKPAPSKKSEKSES